MPHHTIVTMPGDGIGNQVLPEALRVLGAVGLDAEYVHADIGWECWRNEGNALPERTVELLAHPIFGSTTMSAHMVYTETRNPRRVYGGKVCPK